MPAIQYTPVRFPRGKTVHANCIYDPTGTECGRPIGRGVRVVDEPLNCTECMTAMVTRRRAAARAARADARASVKPDR